MNSKSVQRISTPYLYWLYALALFPVLIMTVLVFLDIEGISFDEARFSLGNFAFLIERSTYVAFLNSIVYACLTTIITAVLGYIVAYRVFKSRFNNKFLILTLLILPMWSNLLLRIEALGNIMKPNNIITDFLSRIGIQIALDVPERYAVLIGLVFTYLPFMILPIYTALEKIDYSLEEAALDLGVTETKKFWKVIFPLSTKGIVAGAIMVFLPTMSGFAIPEILGQGNIVMLGNLIEQSFRNMSYNLGSLLAIIILMLILGSLVIVSKVDKEGEIII